MVCCHTVLYICFIVFTDMYAKVMFEDHLMNNPPEIELAETMDNTTQHNLINYRYAKHCMKITATTVLHVERCYVPLEER